VKRCTRHDPAGTIDETGFCEICGRREEVSGRVDPQMPSLPQGPGGTNGSTRPHTTSRLSGELVVLPDIPTRDPEDHVQLDPRPPEHGRDCGEPGCTGRIGAGYAGQPGLVEGFCDICGTPYSFKPKLERDEMVGQYKVIAPVAHGGMGWVYLATDTHLDGYVALKGLIDSNDQRAAEMAVRERRFLTDLDHPNIVGIRNFVPHTDARTGEKSGYIVMDYVDGQPLHTVAAAGLPAEQVIAYGIYILDALAYLHDFTDPKSGRHGLLYCDMKPDNVIHTGRRVKLIDLGAVRWVDDRESPAVGAPGFQIKSEEFDRHGLTPRSDIYAVGKTLEALFHGDRGRSERPRPDPQDQGVESFDRVIACATAPFERRFSSAAEMTEQLRGVLREIRSLRDRTPRPAPSVIFAPSAALLDAGLGAVPSLDRWTGLAGHTIELDNGRPTVRGVAVGLPAPLADPDDPAAGVLANLIADDPRRLLGKLAAVTGSSAEVNFSACRARIALSDLDGAADCLAQAEVVLRDSATHDWRTDWHHGLCALARGDVETAQAAFDSVYGALPGEEAPKLALGFCAEYLGRSRQAERYYQAVWSRDHAAASAAFGLARIRLGHVDRTGAAKVLDEVPPVSRHYDAARIAATRIFSGSLPAGPRTEDLPRMSDLGEAIRRLPELYLDGGDPDGDARARLTTAVQEVALERLRRGGTPTTMPRADGGAGRGAPILGDPADEPHQRALLEESYRRLARQASNPDDHGVLIDLANAIRPATLR